MVPKDSDFPVLKYKTEPYKKYKQKKHKKKLSQEIEDSVTSSDSEEKPEK